MSLNEITQELVSFRNARKWGKHHTEAELARALIIEAAELNELLLWGEEADQERYEEEVADVLIYALYLCEKRRLDPATIIRAKIEKNAIKYPCKTPYIVR